MQELLNHENFCKFKHDDFKRFLQGLPINAGPMPGAIADGSDQEEVLPIVPAAALIARPVAPVIAMSEKTIGDIVVKFDNWSHSSGKRRAYVVCKNTDHEIIIAAEDGTLKTRGCFKYRTLDGFSSIKTCCAYLHAWHTCGQGHVDQPAHILFEPSAAQVSASDLLL